VATCPGSRSRRNTPLFIVGDLLCLDEATVPIHARRSDGHPVQAHLYPDGGHDFGLTKTGHAVDDRPHCLEGWITAPGHP
jgi:hypothetical protein